MFTDFSDYIRNAHAGTIDDVICLLLPSFNHSVMMDSV